MRPDTNAVVIRDGHDNLFTPLRLTFAILVMLGHAFGIAFRDPSMEPYVFFHYQPSYLAVNLFFVASGFLVTKSMLYRGDGPAFASARILRIFPALIVHVLFVMLIIGPIATTLPLTSYFTDPNFFMQPLWVLTFFQTDMVMPGVFENNSEAISSGALWTLRYEVLCYIATFFAFTLGLLRRKWMVLAQFVIPSVIWIAGQSFGVFEHLPATAESAIRFGIAYGLGATIFAYSSQIRFTWVALPVLLAACWLTHKTPMIEVSTNLLLAWLVFFVAYARVPRLNWTKKLEDLSYGIYIYHWAILQLVFSWFPSINAWALFTVCLPVVVGLAWLSWTYVEKPMLSKKVAFGEWLRFGRPATGRPVILAD